MASDDPRDPTDNLSFTVAPPPEGVNGESTVARYGRLQGYFRARTDEYDDLQRDLEYANFAVTVDEYLARTVVYVTAVGAAGALTAGVVAALLTSLIWAIPAAVGGGVLAAACAWGVRRYYPRLRARRRRREIERALPDATLFLYALTRGGMDFYEVTERLAGARGRYGALSEAFDRVIVDTQSLGVDLYTALTRAHESTPSDDFADFLDELVSVLETGGDVEDFLEDQIEVQRERAEERQERLLDDLATVAEGYVVLVFAGPLFLLIVLVVASFARPSLTNALAGLVYVGLPLAILGFAVAVSRFLAPPRIATAATRSREDAAGSEAPEDERVVAYERTRRLDRLRQAVVAPIDLFQSRPTTVFAISAPLGLAAAAALVYLGFATPSWYALTMGAPVRTTTAFVVVPLLIALTPFAVFDRRERARRRSMRERFPTVLEIVGDAVANDVSLGDCFRLVSRRVSGTLGAEMSRVHHDIQWTADVEGALADFADRVRVPAVTRGVGLLTSCLRSTADLEPVFRTVANDLERRNHVRRRRRREIRPYLVVVFLGVLVYLGVIVMFDRHFLPVVADVAQQTAATQSPIELGKISPEVYRRLFYHSVLVQVLGNGLVLGLLVENRARAGATYLVALLALVAVAFTLAV